MEKQKIMLDSSVTKRSKCSLELYRTLIQGYRSKINSQEIEFGTAFHLGVKIYEETLNIGIASHAAAKYYKNKPMSRDSGKKYLTHEYLMFLLLEWEQKCFLQDSFTTLKDTNDNSKPLVEMKFEFKFWESEYCEIWLCGTMDKIGEHSSSHILAIGDYKTNSPIFKRDGVDPIDRFLKDYELDGQLYFYTYCLGKHIQYLTKCI